MNHFTPKQAFQIRLVKVQTTEDRSIFKDTFTYEHLNLFEDKIILIELIAF